MIEQLRRFMASTGGKVIAVILSVLLLATAVLAVKSFLRGDTPEEAYDMMFVCSETGKSFPHRNAMGETTPILSPYSGKNTGYPGEPCYWTKDGQVKKEPTWVLLNTFTGKSEPTFCPDCGRIVVAHNPEAVAGHRAPLSRDEWFAQHQQ